MNYLTGYGKQTGIGLIEVLITMVVVAVGLLAVASLQGDFMSSSGTSKASAQAIKLAEAKTEEFRNNSTSAGFTAIASGTDTVSGGNATFTRTWTVTALTNADASTDPTRKRIAVTVTWPSASGTESVNIVSQVAWLNPGNSANIATAAAGAGVTARAPDPSQNSSTPGAATGQPSTYPAGTGTALNDGSSLSTHTDGAGNIVLLNSGGTVLNTFFGGKINTIKGTVYTVNDFTNLAVAVSETAGICVYTSDAVAISTGEERDYICYTGGNCLNSAGSNGCPASPTAAQLAAQNNVGPGGWYGNIGFLGLGVSGGDQEKVCFVPDVSGFAARGYSTVRTSSGVVTSEGVNRSFACHDFLVVNQTGGSSNCASVISSFDISPEPQKITRTLTGTSASAPNTVLNEDTSYCTVTYHTVTITLSVTGGYTLSSGALSVTPASGTGSCSGSGLSYSCNVPDSVAGSLSFAGLTGSNSCIGTGSYVASSSAQSGSLTIACAVTRDITVTVTPVGTGTVTGTTVTGTGATCVGLTCTVADIWSGTLTATGTCSGSPASVSGTSATIASGATTAAITLADCTAAATHSVEVTLTGGSPTSGTLSVTPVSSTGSCTGSGTSYTCTVPDSVAGSLSFTGSSSGTDSCTGTGSYIASSSSQSATLGISCVPTSCSWAGVSVPFGNTVTGYASALPVGTACVSETKTCQTDGTFLPATSTNTSCLAGCTLGASSVASGSSITTGYPSATVAYPSACTTQSALCTNGTLSPAGVTACTRVCTVPTINGMSTTNAGNIAAVATAITNAGFTVGATTDIGSGTKAVSLQSPASGTTSAACGTAITYTYN